MQSSIPHIIHYIWLGKKSVPESYLLSRESASNHARGFEVKLWTEEQMREYDLPDYFYVLMREGKYAFASDIYRFYILEKYGGLYMDVDQILVKDIAELVDSVREEFFLARYHEVSDYYGFGLLGARAESAFALEMVNFYKNYKGSEYVIVNKVGSEIINAAQNENKSLSVKIFDQEYFYPLTTADYTSYTYAYHMANTSWVPMYKKILFKIPFYKNLKSLASKILPTSLKKKLGFNVRYM